MSDTYCYEYYDPNLQVYTAVIGSTTYSLTATDESTITQPITVANDTS